MNAKIINYFESELSKARLMPSGSEEYRLRRFVHALARTVSSAEPSTFIELERYDADFWRCTGLWVVGSAYLAAIPTINEDVLSGKDEHVIVTRKGDCDQFEVITSNWENEEHKAEMQFKFRNSVTGISHTLKARARRCNDLIDFARKLMSPETSE